jgi:hypothetical protein
MFIVHEPPQPLLFEGNNNRFGALAFPPFPAPPADDEKMYYSSAHLYLDFQYYNFI